MLERDGDVMTKVVPDVRKKTLQPLIEENVEAGSTINSDELRSYGGLTKAGYTHETVNHGTGEYVRGDSHVNGIEGFWARVKLSIRGTHVHVSVREGVRVPLQPVVLRLRGVFLREPVELPRFSGFLKAQILTV